MAFSSGFFFVRMAKKTREGRETPCPVFWFFQVFLFFMVSRYAIDRLHLVNFDDTDYRLTVVSLICSLNAGADC